MSKPHRKYLKPTFYINFQDPHIIEKATKLVEGIPANDDIKKAIRLFYFVRDEIQYVVKNNNDYYNKKNLKATATLDRGYGFCIQKAVLLAALARAVAIPSRLHFNDIINHMTSQKYMDYIGSDRFIYHGYTELFLGEKWVEANVAFDKDLCARKNWPIVEFDGVRPGLFAHHDDTGKPFIDYIKDHGTFADVPYNRIVLNWMIGYGFKMHGKKTSSKTSESI